MSTDAYRQITAAPTRDRLDLFLTTANRLRSAMSKRISGFAGRSIRSTVSGQSARSLPDSPWRHRPPGQARLREAVGGFRAGDWVPQGIRDHVEPFSEQRFRKRLRADVFEMARKNAAVS